MPVQTIEDLSPSRPRGKLAHGQCVNVAGAPLIEITRARVMARMVASPKCELVYKVLAEDQVKSA